MPLNVARPESAPAVAGSTRLLPPDFVAAGGAGEPHAAGERDGQRCSDERNERLRASRLNQLLVNHEDCIVRPMTLTRRR